MKSWYQTGRDLLYGEVGGWTAALLFWPLAVISLVYLLAVKIRNALFDLGIRKIARLPAKVISVGNLTLGGTGKTPWVVFLAGALAARGRKVAVLTRGYKSGREGQVTVVSDGTKILLPVEEAGDEPTLIARRCPGVPVILGARRARSGLFAVTRFGVDTLILDDGFQHRQVARDLDLVAFNTRYGMGNGMLVPGGILREPPSALARAHAVLIHGDGERRALLADYVRRRHPGMPAFRSRLAYEALVGVRTGRRKAPQALAGRRVLAFCGIAIPEAMFAQLRDLAPAALVTRVYPDHFRPDAYEMGEILSLAKDEGVDYIVTSEKDAVKIDPRWIPDPGELFFLEGRLEIEGGADAFLDWLMERIGG